MSLANPHKVNTIQAGPFDICFDDDFIKKFEIDTHVSEDHEMDNKLVIVLVVYPKLPVTLT